MPPYAAAVVRCGGTRLAQLELIDQLEEYPRLVGKFSLSLSPRMKPGRY
ncbi:hypothetical protein ACVINI_006065 [Rhizobium beringeri]|jgi:hypothetical protein